MGGSLTDLVKDIRRLFMLVHSGQCNTMADAIAKDAFIDAFWDKEFTICAIEKEPKSLEKAFKIAERMELYAWKVLPESKDGFESKLKDLVEPGNVFQVYCEFVILNQDCYQLKASSN